MKIIATNIGKPTTIFWNGKEEKTGIYKYPTSEPITLEKEVVANDTIANRKVHGGPDKACYLYSANHYPYWKDQYPNLSWDWGMFGENLSIEEMDDAQIRIGDVFQLGTALVQVSQPREPCYKLGVRFGDQEILRQFIEYGNPGTYVRVLEEGKVAAGDTLKLVEASKNPLTITQFFNLLFTREKDQELLQLAINNEALPQRKRDKLKRLLK